MISHYRILEKLGEGGMGIVYKAEDTRLDRIVALKFLAPHALGSEEDKARFIQEAKAAAALNHSNICTVYEIDESEGQTFIAMEYVEGRSLKDKVNSGPMKLDAAISFAIQIAEGLQEAHEKTVVHRDIKPANIMLTPKGRAKIMDFGLAKLPGREKLTKTQTTVGTVAYMSPEQSRAEPVDFRTDVWSLGVVLYEMISGRLPFRGDYEQAIVYSIINETPEPLTGLRTGVPMELERIVFKCLAKRRDERYPTVADLLVDLSRCLREVLRPAHEAPSVSLQKARRRLSPRWLWSVVAVLVVALAVKFIPWGLTPPGEPDVPRRIKLVVLPFENLGPPEDEYFADGITEEITSRLAAIKGLGVVSRTSALQYKGIGKTVRQIGEELDVDYILEGTVRWADGGEREKIEENMVRFTPQLIRVSDDTHIWSDQYDYAFRNIFDVQTAIAEQVVHQMDITLSGQERSLLQAKPTENFVAYQLYLRALDNLKFSHAPEEEYKEAERILSQAIIFDPQFAMAYTKLARAHRSLYFFGYDRTGDRLAKAKEALDRALQLQPDLSEARAELGFYYYHGFLDYDRAFEELSIAAGSRPNDTELLAAISYIWRRQGLFEQSILSLEQASALSPNDPSLMTELAYSYTAMRNYSKGIELCSHSIAIAPDHIWAYLVKTLCHWCRDGDLEAARTTLEKMQNKRSSSAVWCWYLQTIYEKNYEEALELVAGYPEEVIVMQHSFLPKSLLTGFICSLMDSTQKAQKHFESARELLEREIDKRPDDHRVHSALGLAYAALGRKDAAIREGRRGVDLYSIGKDALMGPRRIIDLMFILVIVEEYDAAIDQIDFLLSIPSYYSVQSVHLDPRLEPLQKHPRIQRLMTETP